MGIIETTAMRDEPKGFSAVRVARDGRIECIEDAVQTETLLTVYVNEEPTLQLMCSKSDLAELVVGSLYAQGVIDSADEIGAVSICEQTMRADVLLAGGEVGRPRRIASVVPTYCAKSAASNDFFDRDRMLAPVVPILWTAEQVFRICDEFALDKTAHSRTRGVHSAYLCTLSETLCLREDIGRHNAFDKCVGWALENGIDMSQCLMYTSGRVPTDMVEKAIRARIPILVSKAVATDKTVEAAREYDLTLICEGKSGSFTVMNDPLGVCSQTVASHAVQAAIC